MPPAINPDLLDKDLLEKLKTLLRRDLKLGPDEPIPDDMPLVGGGADIDSIDVLLVIGSLEREFGVRIPDREVSEQIFASVAALAAYVQAQRPAGADVAEQVKAGNVAPDWRDRLPHGPQFLYVSDVSELRPGEYCRGVWRVKGDEAFLQGHFPGRPIVPGVLITEALAQVGGLASSDSTMAGGVLARVELKFEAPVPPPAEIELEARVRSTTGTLRLCDVQASVGGTVVAVGTIMLSLTQ